jgi:hypothetical protein
MKETDGDHIGPNGMMNLILFGKAQNVGNKRCEGTFLILGTERPLFSS